MRRLHESCDVLRSRSPDEASLKRAGSLLPELHHCLRGDREPGGEVAKPIEQHYVDRMCDSLSSHRILWRDPEFRLPHVSYGLNSLNGVI